MVYPVIFTKTAEAQLKKLQSYLSRRFYPASAERYISRLLKECGSLGASPHRGRVCEDLRPGARIVGFERKTAIYFRFSEDKVTILGIRHGGYEGEPGEFDRR